MRAGEEFHDAEFATFQENNHHKSKCHREGFYIWRPWF